jgi:hypothetical protein
MQSPNSAKPLAERLCVFLLAILFILPAATAVVVASDPIASNRNPPLFFVPIQGQAPKDVQFIAKGSALTAYFLEGEVALRATGALVRMQFVGSAAGARIEGADPLSGRVNFLTDRGRYNTDTMPCVDPTAAVHV